VGIKGNNGDVAAQKESSSSSSSSSNQVEESDGQIQARALKQVMMKLGAQDDEGPALTTRALKELEQARKTLIYSQTLIKINLPDRVCLQGYFHPRDTVQDVVQWLREECFADRGDSSAMETDEQDSAVVATSTGPQYDFDLYTSPPRRSLFSPKLAGDVTLQDLSLVPAAVVHLSWQGASAQEFGSEDSAAGVYSYLSPPLQAQLRGSSEEDFSFQSRSFPSGQKLVPESSKDLSQEADAKSGASRNRLLGSGSGAAGESSGGNQSGKPKWFKL
jgi:hypothetical protein